MKELRIDLDLEQGKKNLFIGDALLYLLHNYKIESMNVKKNILLILIIAFNFALNNSCASSDDAIEETTVSDWKCGTHNGNQLWTGPKGGCYYYNSNDNKTYVDRSECSCNK